MDEYIQLEYKHWHSDKHAKSESLRSEYYSQITCEELVLLRQLYLMDLKMFEYETDTFLDYCIKK